MGTLCYLVPLPQQHHIVTSLGPAPLASHGSPERIRFLGWLMAVSGYDHNEEFFGGNRMVGYESLIVLMACGKQMVALAYIGD